MASDSEKVTVRQQIEFGEEAVDTIVREAQRFRFDAENELHVTALGLHNTIVELCAGCLVLADTNRATGIPILLRSMYEAFVDLSNLLSDASYHEHIEAA